MGKSTSIKRFTGSPFLVVIPTYWQTPNPHPAPIEDDDTACSKRKLKLRQVRQQQQGLAHWPVRDTTKENHGGILLPEIS